MKKWITQAELKLRKSNPFSKNEKRKINALLRAFKQAKRELSFSQMHNSLEVLLAKKIINSVVLFKALHTFISKSFDEKAIIDEALIQTIDKIRDKRNDAGHTYAKLLTQTIASDILSKTEAFLKTWVNAKR